ncbi:MAG: SUMF1/EgtB/PvdO family nonheme iron enzyme [Candidatus Hydrogenedentota bacterium]
MTAGGDASLVGKSIANYKILGELGRGGMGIVYKAMDVSLQRPAAIKVLPPDFADNESFIQRFIREARASAALNHPNIVTVYGVGRHEQCYYIALEFVDGVPLDALISKEGKIEPVRAVRMLRQAVDALAAAHAHKIVHRDIKPQNMMIDKTGRLRVMDFGLALPLSEATKLTQAGTTMGTAHYMSPEQWEDSNVDGRSDIYSLGITFYEMLSGKPPFNASTPAAIMRKVFNESMPSLESFNVAIDPWLKDILAKMVAKKADERFDSAVALRTEIDAYLNGQAPRANDFAPPGVEKELERMDRQAGRVSRPSMPVAETAPPASPTPRFKSMPLWGGLAIAIVIAGAAGALFLSKSDEGFGSTVFTKDDFAWIAPGAYLMGSPTNEIGRNDDENQHEAVISKGFWMGRLEVTQAQWIDVLGSNPSFFVGENLPVDSVSWEDVQAFLVLLNEREGTKFRLPSEAEWEYACRAGSATAFSFGESPSQLDGYGWYVDNSARMTHPAGSKVANAWGLHDVHGNVWEWCQDLAGAYPIGAVTDPIGAESGPHRVGRGGSFGVGAPNCRSADRSASVPTTKGPDLGFRICRN